MPSVTARSDAVDRWSLLPGPGDPGATDVSIFNGKK